MRSPFERLGARPIGRGDADDVHENPMDVQTFKDALLKKRTEILGTGGIKPLQASMENNTRQGDMADQASGNNEVHIQLKLKQTDAKILQAIEEALWRIEKGTYGVCRDCGEPIAAGAAERDSVDARLHHLQGKAELVTDLLPLLQEFHRDKLADAAAARGGRAARRPVRRQQHLPVHHQPRRSAAHVGRQGDRRAGRRRRRRRRAGARRQRARRADAAQRDPRGGRARRPGVRRSLAAAHRRR